MSFFRPEAVAALRRYGEPAIYGTIAVAGLWTGFHLLGQDRLVGALPAFAGLVAGLALFGAVERSLVAWRGRAPGAGVVQVEERRISYFGPQGGAIMSADALTLVQILTIADGPAGNDLYWLLQDEMGQLLAIPGGARDVGRLLDVLGTLPGFDHMGVVAAMGSTAPGRVTLWQRGRQALGRSS